MSEPPMVDLKQRRKEMPRTAAIQGLLDRAEALGAPITPDDLGSVLSTRDHARELVRSRKDVDGTVYLNAQGIEIATPSFFDELLKFWPRAQLVGANPDVQESWSLVIEKREPPPKSERKRR